MSFPFNVRVYGVLVVEGHLLVSHERIKDFSFTKLPGGGLEFGEGPKDCIVREFKEETGLTIKVARHFYTTDFFVPSAFDPSHQVISIYFLLENPNLTEIHAIQPLEPNQRFEWINLEKLNQDFFTFTIDKRLVDQIKLLG